MNKRELFEAVIELPVDCSGSRPKIDKLTTLELIKLLKEPEKVKIPQFVAEYIEKSRLKGWDLLASMCFVLNEKNKKTTRWLYLDENKNIFALAWIYGYEVEEEPEKEKRYWVKLKAVDQYLVSAKDEKFLGFLQSKLRSKFTRKELEEVGFGWVIDCPGIELEEVE